MLAQEGVGVAAVLQVHSLLQVEEEEAEAVQVPSLVPSFEVPEEEVEAGVVVHHLMEVVAEEAVAGVQMTLLK